MSRPLNGKGKGRRVPPGDALADARAQLAQCVTHVAALEAHRDALLVRACTMHLMCRVLAEVAEHRRAHGAEPGPMEALYELLWCNMDSGGGSSVGAAACPANGAAADGGGLFAKLPHLAPGRRVLPLHDLTEEEIAGARAADLAAVKRQARGHYADAVRLARELEAARAARDTAAVERLRAQLRECSGRFWRFSVLMLCWGFKVWCEACVTHAETHELLAGLSDARLPLWQNAAGAAQLTHAQALLITDMQECVQARLQAVRAERALLSSELAAATAAASAASAAAAQDAAGAPADSTGDAAAAAAAAAATRQADLLAAMEANVTAEAALIQAAALACTPIVTPGQMLRAVCAAWPYPLNQPVMCEVLAAKLRLHGADGFAKKLPAD